MNSAILICKISGGLEHRECCWHCACSVLRACRADERLDGDFCGVCTVNTGYEFQSSALRTSCRADTPLKSLKATPWDVEEKRAQKRETLFDFEVSARYTWSTPWMSSCAQSVLNLNVPACTPLVHKYTHGDVSSRQYNLKGVGLKKNFWETRHFAI